MWFFIAKLESKFAMRQTGKNEPRRIAKEIDNFGMCLIRVQGVQGQIGSIFRLRKPIRPALQSLNIIYITSGFIRQ